MYWYNIKLIIKSKKCLTDFTENKKKNIDWWFLYFPGTKLCGVFKNGDWE